MNFHELIKLHDILTRQSIDDRLYFIMNEDPNLAVTTENTVHARSPLKPISDTLDMLLVSPNVPIDNTVNVSSGVFYSRGIPYVYAGGNSGPIDIDTFASTYVLICLAVDKVLGTTSLKVIAEYGNMPQFHSDIVPLALIHLASIDTKIKTDNIIDLRPWLHYDVAVSNLDRSIETISELKSGYSHTYSRKPHHSAPPFINAYIDYDNTTGYRLTQKYSCIEDAIGIHNSGLMAFNDIVHGITIKSNNNRIPITLGGLPEHIFVSAQFGKVNGTGTIIDPVLSLDAAASIFNSYPDKTTIYIGPGHYTITNTLTFDRSVLIIGHSTEEVKLIFTGTLDNGIVVTDPIGKLELRTIKIQPNILAAPDKILFITNYLTMFNCVYINYSRQHILPMVKTENLILSNCVFHNPEDSVVLDLWLPSHLPNNFIGMQNLIILGRWAAGQFQGGPNNLSDQITSIKENLKLENIDEQKYRPMFGSNCIDTGTYTLVNADIDGSAPDIGIYGGKYAAFPDIITVPIHEPVVFKHKISGLVSPIIKNFRSINVWLEKDSASMAELFGAISFNGGYEYVAWDSSTDAWKVIDIKKIHEQGNVWTDLVNRLLNMGDIVTKGEIVIAWGLISYSAAHSVTLRSVDYICGISDNARVVYPLYNLNVLVDDSSIMVTNTTADTIKNLTIVSW